jgi:hypothetical protein
LRQLMFFFSAADRKFRDLLGQSRDIVYILKVCFDMRRLPARCLQKDSLTSRCHTELTATSRTVTIEVRRHISALSYSLNKCRVYLVQRRE